ncbi:MAG: phosphotransferase [Planctomycetes bacterium]|nr:phosphotransferase [Planctomycetota bacterium]
MQQRRREMFDAAELAVVLSHYHLGVIESITEFNRGSSGSPKVGIVAERGKFVLKRRAAERANPERVNFAHQVQTHLADRGFPLAKLILTRDRADSVVRLRDHAYELFEFIAGEPFQKTVSEAYDAGMVLARFHEATEDVVMPVSLKSLRGDYHDGAGVRTGLCSIESTLSSHESFVGNEDELSELVQSLLGTYDKAAGEANRLGVNSRPERIVHLDWHPGNILFRKQRVAAVVDYDSVRQSKLVLDAANGALQFSIIAGGDPATWPDELDQERFDAFLGGYESLIALTEPEHLCVPHLMVEALIAECVPPITRTGTVGRWAGYRVLQMARRKVSWIIAHAQRLTAKGRS